MIIMYSEHFLYKCSLTFIYYVLFHHINTYLVTDFFKKLHILKYVVIAYTHVNIHTHKYVHTDSHKPTDIYTLAYTYTLIPHTHTGTKNQMF